MKYIVTAFAIGMITLVFSCKPSNGKKTVISNKVDSTRTHLVETEQERLEKRKKWAASERIDSIRLDSVLQEAVRRATMKPDNRFSEQYVAMMPDGSNVDVDISSDFYFTKEHPHLMVRRSLQGPIYINIFSKTGKGFRQVLSFEELGLAYIGDTIFDVNGDHLKDFVVNGYGTSGCCLKGFSNVYLLRPDKRSFTSNFWFINPTFSPKEGMIRGICYGHPGETEMYKYRWNGEAVDTVEYVYYEKNDKDQKTGKLILSNNEPGSDNHKVLRRLIAIPPEYEKIEGYDWFTGIGY